MRKLAWVFAFALAPAVAAAQSDSAKQLSSSRPHWDFNVSVAQFNGNAEGPDNEFSRYDDDWYQSGRVAASIGYYWTEHLKTELEFAHTGEGSRFVQEIVRLPNGVIYPYGYEQFHRLQQASVRVVYQFFDNAWVHPYVNAGAVLDIDRMRSFRPPLFITPDSRGAPIVRDELSSGRTTDWGGGVSAGGGAKFYVAQNAYINTGMQVTYGRPMSTVSFLAGFGIDF